MGPLGPALALGCRIVLAVVLVAAAGAKVADRHALPARLQAMGIAPPWSARVAIALPVAEIAVAVALVGAAHSGIPGLLAVVLLGAFTVFLLASSRRAVPCPCFGTVRTASAGTGQGAIVRNGVLIAVAVIATGAVDGARVGGTVVVSLLGMAVAALVITRVA
jgi:hypothetical protein